MDFEDAVDVRGNLGPFLGRFSGCMRTRSGRAHFRTYVSGQISELPRKSVEPIALEAGVHPRTLQEFLSIGRWDEDGAETRVQEIVGQEHASAEAIAPVDETGYPKKGCKTVGVKRQYCGETGKVDNCVVGVSLGYVAGDFHALIARDLYLPKEWLDDPVRRKEARIPDDLVFQTKLQIALAQIDRAQANQVPLKWITADEEYGRAKEFRNGVSGRGLFYVVEVPCSLRGWLERPSLVESVCRGRGSAETQKLRVAPGERSAKRLDSLWESGGPHWQQFRVKDTQKGPEVWRVRATSFYPNEDDLPGERVILIIAENVLSGVRKYFLAHAPAGTSIATILHVAFSRWHIERLFEDGKGEVGMGDFEVRGYPSVIRHLTLSMVSILYLAREAHRLKRTDPEVTLCQVHYILSKQLQPQQKPDERRRQITKVLRNVNYRQCRNADARRFHTRRTIARLNALGIYLSRIPRCPPQI
jgi:SRSO17 transposase